MTETRTRVEHYGSLQERFGGIDTPAAIAGMFTALGVLAFLSSLFAAGAASLPYQLNQLDADGNLQDFEVVAFVVLLVVVVVSFFVGGWAAGRIAVFDGAINGLASAIWMLALLVVFAAAGAFLGAEYNAFAGAELPDWIAQLDADEITVEAGVATIVTILVMFGAAWLGGYVGDRSRLADEVAEVRSRPVTTEP